MRWKLLFQIFIGRWGSRRSRRLRIMCPSCREYPIVRHSRRQLLRTLDKVIAEQRANDRACGYDYKVACFAMFVFTQSIGEIRRLRDPVRMNEALIEHLEALCARDDLPEGELSSCASTFRDLQFLLCCYTHLQEDR